MEHAWRLLAPLLKLHVEHVRYQAALSNYWLANEEHVAGWHLISELVESVLQINGALNLAWLISLLQWPALGAFYSVSRISLVVFDEHEWIEWVLHVFFNQLLLNMRATLKEIVE